MQVEAVMVDTVTQAVVKFSLNMSQEGRPLFVWGRGVLDYPEKPGGLQQNNYYYSLTRVHTEGTLTLGNDVFAVEGLTWMDHEYGYFGDAANPALWFLQTMQLDNGVHISHYTTFTTSSPAPQLDVPVQSNATIEFPDGTTYYQTDCTMTPTGKTWTGPTGVVFFMEFKVEIPSFDAVLHVVSLMDAQDFPFPTAPGDKPTGRDTYEGVAKAAGTFKGEQVHGTAWSEQQS
jgi:predicted secreted hydrolase